ncbi:NAD(P)/FAD-dependent oxidoreductase [Dyella psychrodurans]|uniref:NAD(P)/FAD-dependent oxidoreductase n=1 Tax=Dyella psychrodurans TaxID=1927960 RepID=A0A370XCA0_9GAMM|nr:FAD-dependent oxidoreductase [Dyella psychrodurans]RDS86053.1 NAD(P)/FAD-dependent oxidoreductase [Dyella psychrodurans]
MSATRPRLVVIGNGMAGMRTVEELLLLAPGLYDVAVFGAEPYGNYNRILLSMLLTGEKSVDEIMLNTPEWYVENDIALHTGDPIVAIDRRRRRVHSRKGIELGYDRLLIATGSQPAILPLPGRDLSGVTGFRGIDDVEHMLEAARTYQHAAVIGGGLLGIEAANGLSRRGMRVTLIHRTNVLLNQQLNADAAGLLARNLQGRGLELRLNAETVSLYGSERVEGVVLADGSRIKADLVVMAVGVRPDIVLAKSSGLHCESGIVVDDTLQTYDPHIYAVGECVQHRRVTFGLVAPVWEQARVCASHLARFGHRRYRSSQTATKLKVTGIDLYSAGDFIGGAGTDDLVLRDPRRGVYKRLVLKGNRVVGAVLYGDAKDGGWYFELIRSAADITPIRDRLLFGQDYCQPALDPARATA